MTQRENILDHAMNMFVKQGVKAVRMDDIAKELSVSKRTLYELFEDKEELLFQCIARFAELENSRQQDSIKNIDNKLEVMIFALRDMITHAPVASRLRRNLERFYPTVYRRLNNTLTARKSENLQCWIKECIEDGYLTKTADSPFVLKILVDSCQGIIHSEAFDAIESQKMISYITYAIVIFIRGLCTARGIEILDNSFDKYFSNIPHYTDVNDLV